MKQENNLDKKYTLSFTQREIICMTNSLAMNEDGSPRTYRIGDGSILLNVLQMLQPIAALSTNIPEQPEEAPKPAFEIEEKPAIIGTDADGGKDEGVKN